jgi:DNA modification methylase
VPVSGLEVTAHMKDLDEQGRRIDPFELFERRVERELLGMTELWEHAGSASIRVHRGDATQLTRHVRSRTVDVVITSPPYNTAVDYYRRHTLEMYWLDMVNNHEERLELAPRYLGRVQIRQSNPKLRSEFDSAYVNRLISHAASVSAAQQRAVTHYCASMQRALEHIARILKPRGKAVFVVGNSKWNGRRIRATKLLGEIAKPHFEIAETFSYTTRNRYMSYERHNGANVNREYALVLKKKSQKKPSR